MLKDKLGKAKDAYESEIDNLARQFEEMQNECDQLKLERRQMRNRIIQLEKMVTEQANCIEASGAQLL